MDRIAVTKDARIVVVKHENIFAGLLVDRISAVESIPSGYLQEHSDSSGSLASQIIAQVSRFNGKVRGILDLAKIMDLIVPESERNAAQENNAA